jgi:CelD/BcsL family acetyltransferase involved in cellulose biosynthesis
MTAFTVAREDDFDFSSAEYADLFARSDATAFQHPVWLGALYDVLAPRRGAKKLVVTVRSEDGRLVLVLPLVRRRQGLLRLLEYADLGVNDYAAPVLDTAAAELVADGHVAAQVRVALGSFDLLRIERVPDSPELLTSLIGGATAARHRYDTHLVDLAETVDAWHQRLDPKFVRHLERKYKRLRPKGERRLRSITDVEEIDAFMARMQTFRAARFADRRGTDLVQDPDCFDFYRSVARDSVTAGPARLDVLEVGGEPAAVALNLVERDRELFVLVGYDVERLRNYSLGLLIVDELVASAISRGAAHFDLTVGDEDYKSDFGARARPLFEVRVQRTLRGRAGVGARAGYLTARRLAKRAVIAWNQRRGT